MLVSFLYRLQQEKKKKKPENMFPTTFCPHKNVKSTCMKKKDTLVESDCEFQLWHKGSKIKWYSRMTKIV